MRGGGAKIGEKARRRFLSPFSCGSECLGETVKTRARRAFSPCRLSSLQPRAFSGCREEAAGEAWTIRALPRLDSPQGARTSLLRCKYVSVNPRMEPSPAAARRHRSSGAAVWPPTSTAAAMSEMSAQGMEPDSRRAPRAILAAFVFSTIYFTGLFPPDSNTNELSRFQACRRDGRMEDFRDRSDHRGDGPAQGRFRGRGPLLLQQSPRAAFAAYPVYRFLRLFLPPPTVGTFNAIFYLLRLSRSPRSASLRSGVSGGGWRLLPAIPRWPR